jgi:hypothetical protein
MKKLLEQKYPVLFKNLESEQDEEKRLAIYLTFLESSDAPEKSDFLTLLPEKRAALIDSDGKNIKEEVKSLVEGLQEISELIEKKTDRSTVADKMMEVGVAAFGTIASDAFTETLKNHTEITVKVIKTAIEVALEAAENGGEVGLIIAAIIIAFLPLLYFMAKPAYSTVLIINDLNTGQTFDSYYNTHGKTTSYTTSIDATFKKDGKIFSNAGFFTSSKRDAALRGTQSGFTLKSTSSTFSFGAECPLTGKNNCYCEFDKTAKEISNLTDKKNVLDHSSTKNSITISIKGNSTSGGLAWYVGRIYN